GGLAGRVRSHLIQSDKRRDGSNIDDPAVASFLHMAAEDLTGAQGAREVGFKDAVPFLDRDLNGRSFLGVAGAVHQDVDLAKCGNGRMQEIYERSLIGHVAGKFERAASDGFDFSRGRAHEIGPASRGNYVSARNGESFGDLQPDTARAANDHGSLFAQVQFRMTQGAFSPC